MKKQIVLLGTVFLGVMYLCGMEECPVSTDKEFVTIITPDNKEFKLPIKLAQKSEMISSMQDYQPDEPVVLRLISSQLFQLIKNVLESPNPQQVIMELTLLQLVGFIQAVNFLIIPDLIDISIQELAERNLSQNDLNMLFEQLAEDTIKSLWSVHPAFKWILKGYKLSAKELKGSVELIRFSLDGRYLVLIEREKINVLDANNNFEQVDKNLLHNQVDYAAFSPDGRYLISSFPKKGVIKIWDVTNNFEQVGDDLLHSDAGYVFFSQDGRYLVSSGEGVIKVWDVTNNFEQVGDDLLHHDRLFKVFFSQDGNYLLSQSFVGGTIKIWNVNNNFKQVGDDLSHSKVEYVLFSQDGRYLVSWSYEEGTIKIWDVNNDFEQIGNDLLHDKVTDAVFSPDGRYLVSRGIMGVIKIWDVNNNFTQVGDDLLHNQLFKILFSQDGRYFASISFKEVKIWDLNTFKQVSDNLDYKYLNKVDFSTSEQYLVLSAHSEGVIRILDANNNLEPVGGDLLHNELDDVVFSPDRRYLISWSSPLVSWSYKDKEGTIKIWDVNNHFKQVGNDLLHKNELYRLFFSPDGKYLVFRDDSGLAILDWSIFQHIVTPTLNQIHLFLLLYFAHTENQEPVLSVQLQQAFAYLPLKLKELLKQLAPEFENVFERAEKSFEID